MKREQAEAPIRDYVEGWKHNQPERVLATLNPDCLIIESHGPTYRGREQVAEWIASWFAEDGTIEEWAITSLLCEENAAAFEWDFDCSGSWGRSRFEGISIVRFEDGKIGSLREYRCTTTPFDWKAR